MARETHQREDLLRDARALVPRVMLRIQHQGKDLDVFAGFRGQSLSLYFSDEPVYHFNDRGELRRAFIDGRLVKAERGRLIVLERDQQVDQTLLLRAPADDSRDQAVFVELVRRVDCLRANLSAGEFAVLGQVPADADTVARLKSWLVTFEPKIAASPRVG